MNKYLTLGILSLILVGCTDSNVATKALRGGWLYRCKTNRV